MIRTMFILAVCFVVARSISDAFIAGWLAGIVACSADYAISTFTEKGA